MKIKEFQQWLCLQIIAFESPEKEEIVKIILENKFKINTTDLILNEKEIDFESVKSDFGKIIVELNNNKPIQYVLNEAWFRGNSYFVNENVLIPRSETEEIIDLMDHSVPKTILDLGTGSGCIPISLAFENPDHHIFAIDISDEALKVAIKKCWKIKQKNTFRKSRHSEF